MSDNSAIEYRAFVVSFVNELTQKEIYQVAFIYDVKDEVDKYPSAGLDVFATLERKGVFSQRDVAGLLHIARFINRMDLVRRVDTFTKQVKKRGHRIRKKSKSKSTLPISKEHQLLEQAIETMIKQTTILGNQITLLQKTLQKCDTEVIFKEGRELVQQSSDIAENLSSSLTQVKKDLDLSKVDAVKYEGSQYEYEELCADMGVNTSTSDSLIQVKRDQDLSKLDDVKNEGSQYEDDDVYADIHQVRFLPR